jgi:transcriptional regulator with XRE-family HTH domain
MSGDTGHSERASGGGRGGPGPLAELTALARVSSQPLSPIPVNVLPEIRDFAETLRVLFGALGMSLNRLAALLHSDPGTLSRYLSGKRVPPPDFIDGLCKVVYDVKGSLVTPQVQELVHEQFLVALRVHNPARYEVQRLTDLLQDAAREKQQYEITVAALEEAIASRNDKIHALGLEGRRLRSDWARAEERLEEEKKQRERLRQTIDDLCSEVASCKEHLFSAQRRAAAAEGKCRELEARLDSAGALLREEDQEPAAPLETAVPPEAPTAPEPPLNGAPPAWAGLPGTDAASAGNGGAVAQDADGTPLMPGVGAEPVKGRRGQPKAVGNGTSSRAGGTRSRRAVWLGVPDWLGSRLTREAIIFTGLSSLTMPLLRQLTETARSPRAIVVIEPVGANPLVDEARVLGARVVIGNPASAELLRPIISSLRGCTLSHLYALRDKVSENEAVIDAAARILARYQPDPDRRPHLVALMNDPRHADHWRGTRSGRSDGWFEDALSPAESTAHGLVTRVLSRQPRHLLVCGDSTLTLAILLELARRAWEQAQLLNAAAAGRAHEPDVPPAPDAPSPLPVVEVALLDPRAPDIRREYLASAPDAVLRSLPNVAAHPVRWQDDLLRALDAMDPAQARETAVIIAESPPGSGVHEAGRVARLHPETPVFVLATSGDAIGAAIFDLLHPFEPSLLIEGKVPEDTWTRVARLWHECYRLSHPVPPGHPKAAARVPWSELDPFLKQDNILELRSILSASAACGRQWAPVHLVPPGSVIELSEQDLTEIAIAEHSRWLRRRLAAGQAGESVVPWEELPPRMRSDVYKNLCSQLAQLEDAGFISVVPPGGPPTAASYEGAGLVRASRLTEPLAWVNHAGEQLHGSAGDWRVIDDAGSLHTVTDPVFRSSHEPTGDGRWRRVGSYRAWQVSEAVVVRTWEGRATARPGDWVVEAPTGGRWPVTEADFKQGYRPSHRPRP